MTESEKTVVQKLLLATSGKIKFYCRYVDDTLCYGNDVLLSQSIPFFLPR